MTPDDQLAEVSTELHDLSGDVHALGDKLDDHRAAYLGDKAATEKRVLVSARKARRATFAGVVGVIVGVVATGVAVFAVVLVMQANAERATRTVTSCQQSADKALKDNAQDEVFIDLLSDVAGGSDNPQTASFLAPYIDRINANKSKVRDCSDEGIRKYNETHGAEGFLP